MRWELLFGDLEAQLQEVSAQELEREINELARIEASQLTFAEALRGAGDDPVSITLPSGTSFHGSLVRVEKEWLLLDEGNRSVLVPLVHVLRVQGLGIQRARAVSRVPYSLAAALRVLARNRSVVVVELESARTASVRGVLDQVGADYVELLQLADGVSRAAENRQGRVVLPMGKLLSIASSVDNEF